MHGIPRQRAFQMVHGEPPAAWAMLPCMAHARACASQQVLLQLLLSSPPPDPPSRLPPCHSQVKAKPPLPSTRLAFLSVLLSLGTLVVCHGIPFTLLRALRWYKARRRLQAATGGVQLAEDAGAAKGGAASPAAKQQQQQQPGHHAGKRVHTGLSRRLRGLRQVHPRLFLVAFMAGLSIFSALSLTMITIAPSYVDPSIGAHRAGALWIAGSMGYYTPPLQRAHSVLPPA